MLRTSVCIYVTDFVIIIFVIITTLSQVVCGKENGLKMNFHQKLVNNRLKTLHEIP